MSIEDKAKLLIGDIKKEIEELEWIVHCTELKLERLEKACAILSHIDDGYGPDEDDYFASLEVSE